ncbi:ACRC-like protein, partial [Mya arenaria]
MAAKGPSGVDAQEMFERMGKKLGWFQHGSLEKAMHSLSESAKKKRPTVKSKLQSGTKEGIVKTGHIDSNSDKKKLKPKQLTSNTNHHCPVTKPNLKNKVFVSAANSFNDILSSDSDELVSDEEKENVLKPLPKFSKIKLTGKQLKPKPAKAGKSVLKLCSDSEEEEVEKKTDKSPEKYEVEILEETDIPESPENNGRSRTIAPVKLNIILDSSDSEEEMVEIVDVAVQTEDDCQMGEKECESDDIIPEDVNDNDDLTCWSKTVNVYGEKTIDSSPVGEVIAVEADVYDQETQIHDVEKLKHIESEEKVYQSNTLQDANDVESCVTVVDGDFEKGRKYLDDTKESMYYDVENDVYENPTKCDMTSGTDSDLYEPETIEKDTEVEADNTDDALCSDEEEERAETVDDSDGDEGNAIDRSYDTESSEKSEVEVIDVATQTPQSFTRTGNTKKSSENGEDSSENSVAMEAANISDNESSTNTDTDRTGNHSIDIKQDNTDGNKRMHGKLKKPDNPGKYENEEESEASSMSMDEFIVEDDEEISCESDADEDDAFYLRETQRKEQQELRKIESRYRGQHMQDDGGSDDDEDDDDVYSPGEESDDSDSDFSSKVYPPSVTKQKKQKYKVKAKVDPVSFCISSDSESDDLPDILETRHHTGSGTQHKSEGGTQRKKKSDISKESSVTGISDSSRNLVNDNDDSSLFKTPNVIKKKGNSKSGTTPKTSDKGKPGKVSFNEFISLSSGSDSDDYMVEVSTGSVSSGSDSDDYMVELPADMRVEWNKRLLKTAGFCAYKKIRKTEERTARIELSDKVCDTADRLRDTLIHEMCHAGCWLINGVNGGPASQPRFTQNFQLSLGAIVMPSTQNTLTDSMDLKKWMCGKCKGQFELLVNLKPTTPGSAQTAVPTTPRTPNRFALFVKDNYKVVKQRNQDLKHGDVMKEL